MFPLLLRSLRLYLAWWLDSLLPGRHAGAPLGLKRLALLLIGYPLLLLLLAVHWAGFALDELLFPGYRRTPVREPVFITGIPRSGTTFLHRALSRDDSQFTTLRSWEVLLAPSITERRILRALNATDRALGGCCRRAVERLIARAAGDFDEVHEVGLTAPEEDYLLLLPAAACFILALAFPFRPELWALGRFGNTVEPAQREALLDFYQRCLQKHLYCEGRGRRLLSKNAAFASWTRDLAGRFADARFIVCVREPASALSSQLASIAPAHALFATDPAAAGIDRRFLELYTDNYRVLADTLQELPAGRAAAVDMDDLKRDPAAQLDRITGQLGITGERLAAVLADAAGEARGHRSRHRHALDTTTLDAAEIRACMELPYRQILGHCARHRDPPQDGTRQSPPTPNGAPGNRSD